MANIDNLDLTILRRKLAEGEITLDDYNTLRKELRRRREGEGGADTPPPPSVAAEPETVADEASEPPAVEEAYPELAAYAPPETVADAADEETEDRDEAASVDAESISVIAGMIKSSTVPSEDTDDTEEAEDRLELLVDPGVARESGEATEDEDEEVEVNTAGGAKVFFATILIVGGFLAILAVLVQIS